MGMGSKPLTASLRERLSGVASQLQAARRDALAAIDAETTTWEYAGRTWSWPAGEARTYFHDLAPGERAVLADAREAIGIEPIGTGTGRVAVILPADLVAVDAPLVVKLARYGPSAEMGAGRPQNRREHRLWTRVESHPFLPVLAADADGDWLAMPRATVPPPAAERDAAMRRVRRALSAHADAFHFDELKVENVGTHRGRYWVVDYGRPPGEPRFVDPP